MDVGRPQAAIVRLGDSGAFAGTVLDPGCGTGEHALLLAAALRIVVDVWKEAESSTQVAAIFSDPKGLLNYVVAKDSKKQAEG